MRGQCPSETPEPALAVNLISSLPFLQFPRKPSLGLRGSLIGLPPDGDLAGKSLELGTWGPEFSPGSSLTHRATFGKCLTLGFCLVIWETQKLCLWVSGSVDQARDKQRGREQPLYFLLKDTSPLSFTNGVAQTNEAWFWDWCKLELADWGFRTIKNHWESRGDVTGTEQSSELPWERSGEMSFCRGATVPGAVRIVYVKSNSGLWSWWQGTSPHWKTKLNQNKTWRMWWSHLEKSRRTGDVWRPWWGNRGGWGVLSIRQNVSN